MTSEVLNNPTPCFVCGDKSSGRHYGVLTCDGCRGFFKRSVRRSFDYLCRGSNECVVDLSRRNQCQACRMKKCLEVGMRKDAVQHERAPRNSKKQQSSEGLPTFTQQDQPTVYYTLKDKFLKEESLQSSPSSTTITVSLSPPPQITSQQRHPQRPITPPEIKKDDMKISSANQLYELSIHLLYNAITWAKNIPTFTELPFSDQTLLLGNGWSEIFLLSLAHWDVPLDLGYLMEIGYESKKRETPESRKNVVKSLIHLQNIVDKLRVLALDNTEFACAKAVVLFKPDMEGIRACSHVDHLQEKAQLMLHDYIISSNDTSRSRFGKILLKLPLLTEITESLIEKYFFKGKVEGFSHDSPKKHVPQASRFLNNINDETNSYEYDRYKSFSNMYETETQVHIIQEGDEICYDEVPENKIEDRYHGNKHIDHYSDKIVKEFKDGRKIKIYENEKDTKQTDHYRLSKQSDYFHDNKQPTHLHDNKHVENPFHVNKPSKPTDRFNKNNNIDEEFKNSRKRKLYASNNEVKQKDHHRKSKLLDNYHEGEEVYLENAAVCYPGNKQINTYQVSKQTDHHHSSKVKDYYTLNTPRDNYLANKQTNNHHGDESMDDQHEEKPIVQYQTLDHGNKPTSHYHGGKPEDIQNNSKSTVDYNESKPINYYHENKAANHYHDSKPTVLYYDRKPKDHHHDKRTVFSYKKADHDHGILPTSYSNVGRPANIQSNSKPAVHDQDEKLVVSIRKPDNNHDSKLTKHHHVNKPTDHHNLTKPTVHHHDKKTMEHHHGNKPTEHHHGNTPTEHYHGNKPTEYHHGNKLTEYHYGNKLTDHHHDNKPTEQHHYSKLTEHHPGNTPTEHHHDNKPTEHHHDNKLIEHHPGNTPTEHYHDNKTTENYNDNKPTEYHHDNTPTEHHHDNKPTELHPGNTPTEHYHDNKTAEHHHDNKPTEHHHDNKPTEHHPGNTPTEHYHDNKTTEHHHDNKPTEHHHENKPTEHHREDKPADIRNDIINLKCQDPQQTYRFYNNNNNNIDEEFIESRKKHLYENTYEQRNEVL